MQEDIGKRILGLMSDRLLERCEPLCGTEQGKCIARCTIIYIICQGLLFFNEVWISLELLTFRLNDPKVYEQADEAIRRGEDFSVAARGFRATMVKKSFPILKWSFERDTDKPNRRRFFLSAIYLLFTKTFSAIYYQALKAGMKAEVDESKPSTFVVSFKKIGDKNRLHNGLRRQPEKG